MTFIKGSGFFKNLEIKSSRYKVDITANEKYKILVNTAYFPRWSIYVDGKKARVAGTDKGLFTFSVEKGKHSAEIVFEDTYIRQLAALLFFLSFLIIFVLFVKSLFVKIKR